ncbi:hypothetical protein [Bradyrhizobium sp.]|uniref:hypothetical protein n=1 Tax=Bradyrhizobium sp. TaxID=376 RepID=UPI00261337A1|nr:hypothetical protein [Bradyrhizobium sp.]
MGEAGLQRMVPYGADQTLFVIVDRIGVDKEIRVERPDLETALGDLVAGCFSDPVRVIAFNTLEHWVKDVSTEVAAEIQSRCDIDGEALPDHIREFVESWTCPARRTEPELRGIRAPRAHLLR